jgi:predicted nucleotidyltransferase component of viral defense system
MHRLSIKEAVELFHLLFLDQMSRKIDRSRYVLKGGCNLRFYFNSIRYSEDIDLDIKTIQKETLQKNINKILSSTPFKVLLKNRGIEINAVHEAKQTQTTQRWKITLLIESTALPIHTKVEFSRRENKDEIKLGSITGEIVAYYQVAPILLSYYSATSMIKQKTHALSGRTETQARDVFDLYWLYQQTKLSAISSIEISQKIKKTAVIKAMSISYEQYNAQVVSYLKPEFKTQYGDDAFWEKCLTSVIDHIERENETT